MLCAILAACGGDSTGVSSEGPPGTRTEPDATTLVVTPSTFTLNTQVVTPYRVTMSNGMRPTEEIVAKSSNERVVFASHDTLRGRAPGTATVTITAGARSTTFAVTVPSDVAIGEFVAPLDSVPSVISVFDHDKPHQFSDTNGFLLTYWGEKTTGIDGHNGYDWPVSEGTPVRAVANGTVVFAGSEAPGSCPLLDNRIVSGLTVRIAHAAPPSELILSEYLHFSRIDVKSGDRVNAGQQIGLSGTTGCSTLPHLHLSAYRMLGSESVPRAFTQLGFRQVDPFGWTAPAPDPWMADTSGIESVQLWKGAKAPIVYREAAMPGGGAQVIPGYVRYWTGDPATQQYIEVGSSSNTIIDIGGWTIENSAGARYTFPGNTRVSANPRVRLYTGSGANTEGKLYWGSRISLWGASGDCVTIRRPDGTVEYSRAYGTGTCGGVSIAVNHAPARPLDAPLNNRPPIVP